MHDPSFRLRASHLQSSTANRSSNPHPFSQVGLKFIVSLLSFFQPLPSITKRVLMCVCSVQCSAATNHLITNAVLNISSDIMIILIPMPMFIQSQMPRKRKAILCGVFALGAFTVSPRLSNFPSEWLVLYSDVRLCLFTETDETNQILSAILNKFYSFSQPFGSDWTFWYIRESSTALIVANLPLTWPLLRRVFDLRSFNAESSNLRYGQSSSRFHSGTAHGHAGNRRGDGAGLGHSSGSQERINTEGYAVPLQIYRHRDFQVHSQPVSDDDGAHSSMGYVIDGLSSTTKSVSCGGVKDWRGEGHRNGIRKVFCWNYQSISWDRKDTRLVDSAPILHSYKEQSLLRLFSYISANSGPVKCRSWHSRFYL